MDSYDRRLLELMQADATLSVGELAERISLSKTACWRRVQKLERQGVIRGRVTLLERSPLVHALLADGLARATGIGDPWLTACVARMTLVKANAVDWLDHSGAASVDVVYLDPMFPQRRKAARAKKEMWLFQHLEAAPDRAAARRPDRVAGSRHFRSRLCRRARNR